MAQVRKALNGNNFHKPTVARPIPEQPGLFAEVPTDTPKLQAEPKDNLEPEPAAEAGLPAMTAEEANKILRVTAATSWPDIEQARRQLVQKAHPDNLSLLSSEKREATRTLAPLANTANHVLHRSKLSQISDRASDSDRYEQIAFGVKGLIFGND